MAKRINDDLFEGTSMSFGEHLEELRKALFKSMFGLVIGVLLGLLCASWVVDQIQAPLKRSLEAFYANKAIDAIEKQYPKSVSEGHKAFIRRFKVIYEDIYLEQNLLGRFSPSAESGDTPEPVPADTRKPAAGKTAAPEPAEDELEAQEPVTVAPQSPAPTPETKPEPGVVQEAEPDNDLWARIQRLLGRKVEESEETSDQLRLQKVFKELLPAPDTHMVKTRIWRPLDVRITSLSAQEVFMIWMKAALIAGLVISSPYIFFQIWNFVAAGLYPHEKNYVYMYLPFSLCLFLLGAALAFFFVFDPVLEFLFKFNKSMGIDPDPRINEWLGFVLYMPLGFGISFQLPLVMLFLNRIGIFSITIYLAKWRIAILTIFVISMVLTPADPVSMLLMALPLTFLYFFGVGLCRWMPRGRNPFDADYEPA